MKMTAIILCTTLIFTWTYAQDLVKDRSVLLTREQAVKLSRLPLKCMLKEYPNKLSQTLADPSELANPKILHPAFYGCFDWHSSVHGHWMLVRLLRRFPDLPERQPIRAMLEEHLTAKNLQAEADYFTQPNRQSFERTYGWA